MARPSQRNAQVKVEHLGNLAYVVIRGNVDETFDPASLASAIKSTQLVINTANVSQISSFGLAQWLKLHEEISRRVSNLYFVECSPTFVDQLGLVTGFAGNGKVLSFYAPYTCEGCGTNRSVLFRTDLDQEIIRTMSPPPFTCRVCQGREVLDEVPEAYLSYFAKQGPVTPPDEVAALLQARLDYATSAASSRPHVEKYARGRKTFVSIRGSLDRTLPTSKIVAGLEGPIVIDTSGIVFTQQGGIPTWDELVTELVRMPAVEHVYFAGLPPLALERGSSLTPHAMERATILSVTLPYSCSSCGTTSWQQLETATGRENQFTSNTLPSKKCPDCGDRLQALVSGSLLEQINALPAAKVPKAIARFAKRGPERIEAQRARFAPSVSGRSPAWIPAVAAAAVLLLGGGAATAWYISNAAGVTNTPQVVDTNQPRDRRKDRPAWISSDTPASAYCFDAPIKVTCVGVSSFQAEKDAALLEARQGSLEELVNLLTLRSESRALSAQRDLYWKTRQQTISKYDERPRVDKALEELRRARANVAEGLMASAGPVFTPQTTTYWEEYEASSGGTEFLGFSRIELSNATIQALIERYSDVQVVGGLEVALAFPGLSWILGEPAAGVFVLGEEGRGALTRRGIGAGEIVIEVGGKQIREISDLADAAQLGGDVKKLAFKEASP